jgi:LEA14-like dessication related protein
MKRVLQKKGFFVAKTLIYVFLAVVLSSCAWMRPGYETPQVQVTRFVVLESQGLAPQFAITLHVVNPNRSDLEIAGLSYTIDIEGITLLRGVKNNIPVVAGYAEQDVTLTVTADLINSLRLISELTRQPHDDFTYLLTAKLDLGWAVPAVRIEKQGDISLRSLTR